MSSNRTRHNRLLTIVVFTVGILALAWFSQPPTLPLYRAISRVFPGGHFEERWITGNHPYELVWSGSPMIDLPKQGAPWKHTGTHLTQGVTFENRRVPEGFQRGVWANIDMNAAGETFQLELAPMRRWKGTLTFESETSAPVELQLEVAAPWRDIGSPGSWLQSTLVLGVSLSFLAFFCGRKWQESSNGEA
ncbi:MAG TPA: hypothetical protein EYQ74_02340 [Planctomycetes bacterium]|nr:hypothetical protein [Planctomycetota bacterium]HIK61574.1 hypothetical protein [Planctomycetota bacterium]